MAMVLYSQFRSEHLLRPRWLSRETRRSRCFPFVSRCEHRAVPAERQHHRNAERRIGRAAADDTDDLSEDELGYNLIGKTGRV